MHVGGTNRGVPSLAISIGDPRGIGPEIVVRALLDPRVRDIARYRVFGCRRTLLHAARACGLEEPWRRATQPDNGTLRVLDDGSYHDLEDDRRDASAAGGAASLRWVELAINAAKLDPEHPEFADAIVTAPISKTSWDLSGNTRFPGHTELLAERFGVADDGAAGMLFVAPLLNVMLATIHLPLMRVREQLSPERLTRIIRTADRAMRELGVAKPRIAVCGLNPHAGEGGILGTEDGEIIEPSVANARAAGVDAHGPLPGDTVFSAAAKPPFGKGRFDCVVAMYHDQGLIPVKLLHPLGGGNGGAVNMTVGLPTVRTSPAHGTAFDIAGQGVADHGSMVAAIEVAVRACTSAKLGRAGVKP